MRTSLPRDPLALQIADKARASILSLFAKHEISDPKHAKQQVRERFSDEEYEVYEKAMAILDGMGELG